VDILEGATLLIRGLPASNVTYFGLSQNASALFFPPANFSLIGYSNLSVLNPDGGYTTAVDVMFFSEDCPFVGTRSAIYDFRRRRIYLDMRRFYRIWAELPHMPTGCAVPRRQPHLARVWLVRHLSQSKSPAHDNRRWTRGEFSGDVGACEPAPRCLGGRFSDCRPGHTGDYCSRCIEGYYMDTNDLCSPCQPSSYLAMLFVLQVRRWGNYC
jgi:hypothetical protein